jgi:hypothetical protein
LAHQDDQAIQIVNLLQMHVPFARPPDDAGARADQNDDHDREGKEQAK